MSTAPERPTFGTDPAVRTYTLICLAALLFMLVAQMEQGLDPLVLLTLLAGVVGLVLHSNLASLMVLLALGGRIFLYYHTGLRSLLTAEGGRAGGVRVSDIILSCAVLAYVMAHYRLLGLVRNVFPNDPRRRDGPKKAWWWFGEQLPASGLRRSPRLAGPVEWAFLLLALPVFALLAQVVWRLLPGPRYVLNLPPWFWALFLPAWVIALLLIVASGLLGYWRRRSMTPEEGQVLLQDTLWRETRREQRWVNRWLAWDRWRRQRREEKP